MSTPVLQVWTAPKCQADAQPLAPLPATVSAQITESLGGNESGAIVLDPHTARASSIAEGRVIRAVLPLRGVIEWVVNQVSDRDPDGTVSVTLSPLRHLLALRGFVRETTERATVLTFRPNPLTVGEFLTRYVLTNLAADGLAWLSLGTVEYDDLIDPGEFTAVRRGELLTLVERITGYEVQLRRRDNDAGYAIDVLQRRGASLPPLLFETPATALEISRSRDLANTATAVMPIGDDNRGMGEVDWIGGAAAGAGPFWIPLTDPAGGEGPIREDTQFANAFLRLADASTLPIITTRASDSAVQVAALGTYTTGQRVILSENSAGRPIAMLPSPSAIADSRGLVVARVSAKGARQERTLNRNAGFEDGATHWSEVNGTGQGVAIPRAELGLTLSMQANGARAGGTSTATPLAVDGLPANAWIRRGDVLEHAAASRDITANAVSTSTGALSLTIASPGLPANYSDGQAFTLRRRIAGTAVSTVAMPRLGGVVYLTAASVGTLDLLVQQAQRSMTGPLSTSFSGPNGFALNFFPVYGDDSRIAVQYAFSTNDPLVEAADWELGVSAITATAAQRLTVTLNGTSYGGVGTPSASDWVVFEASANWSAIDLQQSRAPYLTFAGSGIRLIGQVVSATSTQIVVDLVGYPTGADFRNVGTITPTTFLAYPIAPPASPPAGPSIMGLTNVFAAGSSFTISRPVTNRPVQFNGAYSSGATAITTKNVTAIATRAWQSGDTLYWDSGLPTVTFTANITSHTGMTGTISTSGSNVQNYPLVELQGVTWTISCSTTYDVYDNATSSYIAFGQTGTIDLDCTLSSRSGLSYTFVAPSSYEPGAPDIVWFIVSASIATTQVLSEVRTGGVRTYAVTGAGSYSAATGIATVPLSLPTGFTMRRGDVVWSNFHGSSGGSAMRVAATVAGPVSSVTIFGGDNLVGSEADTPTPLVAAYRVFGGTALSDIQLPGNTMVAASSVQANGSGAANVTLTAAPANDIADNAAITITRPTLLGVRDRMTGSVLRLLFAPGTPITLGTTAMQSEAIWVPIATGEPQTLTAVARFRVTPEALAIGQAPAVALVNTTTNAILATGTISSTTTYAAPYGDIVCSASASLAASANVAVRIYGGSNSLYSRWHVCTDASFYVGTEVLPYIAGARSRVGFQRGQDILAQRKSSARYQVRGLDQSALADAGTPIQLGQSARLRSAPLGLDTTQRIVRLVWQWPGGELVEVECEALTPRFTDVTVSL